jgi:hypothetical protein
VELSAAALVLSDVVDGLMLALGVACLIGEFAEELSEAVVSESSLAEPHPDRHAAISPTATAVICFACTMSFRMTLKTAGRSTQTTACHPSDEAADVWLALPRRLRNP